MRGRKVQAGGYQAVSFSKNMYCDHVIYYSIAIDGWLGATHNDTYNNCTRLKKD